jgi:hypothetical protein
VGGGRKLLRGVVLLLRVGYGGVLLALWSGFAIQPLA